MAERGGGCAFDGVRESTFRLWRRHFFVASIGLEKVILIAPMWTDLRPHRPLDECEMGVRASVSNRASTL
jgi:hypothetical protein